MKSGFGLNELRRYPNFVARRLYAAFQHCLDIEFLGDLADIDVLPLELERGIARHDSQAVDLREFMQHGVRQPVGKVTGILILAHIHERQHGNRLVDDFGCDNLVVCGRFCCSLRRRVRSEDRSIRHNPDDGNSKNTNDNLVEARAGSRRYGCFALDILLALDTFRGQFIDP